MQCTRNQKYSVTASVTLSRCHVQAIRGYLLLYYSAMSFKFNDPPPKPPLSHPPHFPPGLKRASDAGPGLRPEASILAIVSHRPASSALIFQPRGLVWAQEFTGFTSQVDYSKLICH